MEILKLLFIEKMWNNINFWHILFLTTIISIIAIKLLSLLNKKVGVFQKHKQYDYGIYRKTFSFLSEKDMLSLLDDLQETSSYKKSRLQQINDFTSLMSSQSNTYKSEILRTQMSELLESIGNLQKFLVVNFSEEPNTNIIKEPTFALLIDIKKDSLNKNNDTLFEGEDAKKLVEEKQRFFLQKERELKDLTQKTRDDFKLYRNSVKKYLNV